MTPTLAKSLDNERFLTRLMYLLTAPTPEMIQAGNGAIVYGVVAEYIGTTAAKDILHAMVEVALKQADG